MPDSTLSPSSGEAAATHVIRCADCHELVAADRVRHREERVKVASRAAPGRWRSGGPPIFRPSTHGPPIATGGRPAAAPYSAYAIERIPVCVDCLRRQKMGLYGVCCIAAACLIAAAFLYTQQASGPSNQEVAVQAPAASHPTVTAKPAAAPPPAAENSSRPPSIWAKAAASLSPPAATAPVPPPLTGTASPPAGAAPASPAPDKATTPAPADASPTETATADAASPEPPIWQSHLKPSSPRKVAKATPSARRESASTNALALRNSGYAALGQRRYREALSLLQQATVMGDPYAPMYIGQIFEIGIGVPRNVGQASYWYSIAINRGNSVALTAFNRLRASPY